MKRLFTMTLLLCSLVGSAQAQRITRNFQNVSMSDALKYIQQQTRNHKIVFIYNELEDFTVTTHVKNKPVPDAIRQIIGFYPIQMILGDNNDIYVECMQKTEHRLKGTIVDIQEGAVNGIVKIDIGGGNVISSTISMNAIKELDLKIGKTAYAVIKATSVMVGIDD